MSKIKKYIYINGIEIGGKNPTYFIADIAANHDGSLSKAKDLIYLAKLAGADAAKFQHFNAKTIVSDFGFKALGGKISHQSSWAKSVYEIYEDATVDTDWTLELKQTCDKVGIAFFSSPYDFSLVDHIDPFVPAYKIGSGDITWIDLIRHIARKGKPYIIATGASTLNDVKRAVNAGVQINSNIALLQCNTNYTGSLENMKYVQLNVLKCYREVFPEVVLGLSDHTPGHATVLGAVSLGASIIEKHFTDDKNRIGPDHKFSMNPQDWSEMVLRTRELEAALGNNQKVVEDNERETVVLQRRSLRSTRDLYPGHVLQEDDFIPLRPCPSDALLPYESNLVIGKELLVGKMAGDYFKLEDFK